MQLVRKFFIPGISVFLKVFFPVLVFSSAVSYSQIHAGTDWLRRYEGIPGGNDFVNDAVMDHEFNTYLAGSTEGNDGTRDLRIVSFSRSDIEVFNVSFMSALNAWDEALSAAVDDDKNVYAAGNASFGLSTFFAVIFKFKPDGTTAWSKYFSFPSAASHLVLDNNGNPVTGYLDYESNSASFIKYSAAGDSLWTTSLTSDSGWLYINYLMSDMSGNIYALLSEQFPVSLMTSGNQQEFNIILLKMDENGNVLWKRSWHGESPRKLVSDRESNIIIITNGGGQIIKYKNNGDTVWSVNTNGLLTDAAVDSDNNLIVTGYTGGAGGFDYMTKKFSPGGSEIWSREFNSYESLRDFAGCITLDKNNNIYVSGSSHDMFTQGYCYTLRYNPEGQTVWEHRFVLPSSQSINPVKIFLDDSTNIYLAGDLSIISVPRDFFLLKLKQNTGVGVKDDNNIQSGYSLSQNYPNPFNPSTTIKYSLSSDEFVIIKVTDVLGREAVLLVNEVKLRGEHEIRFNASSLAGGVYIYTIKAGDFTDTRKMIILK